MRSFGASPNGSGVMDIYFTSNYHCIRVIHLIIRMRPFCLPTLTAGDSILSDGNAAGIMSD